MESFNINERVIGFDCKWDMIRNVRGDVCGTSKVGICQIACK